MKFIVQNPTYCSLEDLREQTPTLAYHRRVSTLPIEGKDGIHKIPLFHI
jgi:hypothetical protein